MSRTSLLLLISCLRNNKTLIFIDLSYNKITDSIGVELCKALESNLTLYEMNISNNYLGDQFAILFSKVLQSNPILQCCDISLNSIGNAGAEALLSALTNYNDTLKSLGDLSTSYGMGVRNREEIRQVLLQNTLPKELKTSLIENSKFNELLTTTDQSKTTVRL